MSDKNYYSILGVSRDASDQDIKKAYRRLARKYHPDVSKEANAEQHFKEIGEAYEVLGDKQKRAAYDQFGSHWKTTGGSGGAQWQNSGGGNPFGSAGGAGFGDFFENIFGQGGSPFSGNQGFGGQSGRRGAGFSQQGESIESTITIDVSDSYQGTTRSMNLNVGGQRRTLSVKIPKGIKAGQKIRLSGQGNPGMGQGQNGDLFLKVEFNRDDRYRVDGHNVYYTLQVTPWEAALGEKVSVPLPDGKHVDVKIPANSSGGRKMRLRGRGLPAKQVGDFYIELQILLPKADTEQAKKAYQAFRDAFTV